MYNCFHLGGGLTEDHHCLNFFWDFKPLFAQALYRPRFFRLQPSFISITLVPTNYPSPASIPACPAVSCLAHSSRPLPHNHARPTVSRTVAHPCRLLPFRFGLSFPSRPASSIHRSSPCIKPTATLPQFHLIIRTSTIRDERHHVLTSTFPRSLIPHVHARLVIDRPARDLGTPSSTIGVRSRELRHASSPNDATSTPFDCVLVVNPKFSESIRIPLNTPVTSPSKKRMRVRFSLSPSHPKVVAPRTPQSSRVRAQRLVQARHASRVRTIRTVVHHRRSRRAYRHRTILVSLGTNTDLLIR